MLRIYAATTLIMMDVDCNVVHFELTVRMRGRGEGADLRPATIFRTNWVRLS